MTGALPARPGWISRRAMLLLGSVAGASGVALIGSTPQAHAAKMAQTAAGYQTMPKGTQQCDNCLLFQPPSGCQLVDGTISSSGWCRFYAKKSS